MFLTKQPAQTSTPALAPNNGSSALHARLKLARKQFPYHDQDYVAQAIVSGYLQLQQQQPALKFYSSEHGVLTVKVLLPVNIYRLMTSLQGPLIAQAETALNNLAPQLPETQQIRVVCAPDTTIKQDELLVVFGSSNLQQQSNSPSIAVSHQGFYVAARANTNAVAVDDYLLSTIDPRLQGRLGQHIIVFEHTAAGHVSVHAPDTIPLSWPADNEVELFFSAERRLKFKIITGQFVPRPASRSFFVQPQSLFKTDAATVDAPLSTQTEPTLSFSAVADDESAPALHLASPLRSAQMQHTFQHPVQQPMPHKIQLTLQVTLQALASAGRPGAGPFCKAAGQKFLATEQIQRLTGISEFTAIGSGKKLAVQGQLLRLSPQQFPELPQAIELPIQLSAAKPSVLIEQGYLLDGDTLTAISGALPLTRAMTLLIGSMIVTLEVADE
ncbi:hypothetical protein [Rheinheimera sp. F8]|uniref:hypothetical protein n=1 Tax=Rheinheimera sp. F8 TaxID=1763998 RepID=UPI0007449F9A|nr:hypothetical protein [Rheinheimera sp. F8]ALZ76704.1 hypothetical protein ATY27_13680 [Rheinheimera sp. F8]